MVENFLIGGVGIFVIFLWLFIIGLIIASVVFWIWMLIDVLTRKFPDSNDQLIWVLVIILAGFIGAIIYYFVGRSKGKKVK